MQQLGMGQAINQALREEMERDPAVFLAGEGVGVGIHSSPMLPTAGLLQDFGPERVRDTPVSEAAIAGLAVGAAEAGLRPVVEIMFTPFLTLASDMIVNHAAKWHYLTNGQVHVPLIIRAIVARGWGSGAQHAQALHGVFLPVPGLRIVLPASPHDVKGLFLQAVNDGNPVKSLVISRVAGGGTRTESREMPPPDPCPGP